MGGSLAPGYSNIPADVGKEPQGPPPLPARTVEGIVDLVMPLYYTKEQITPDELVAAKKLWRMIVNNQSEYFFEFQRELRKAGGTPPELCGEYLLNLWVLRLLDIHPQAKPLFEKVDRTKMRIHFLSMITMLIDCAGDDPEKFKKSLQGLVKAHGVIGVRSCEFGIGAEIMMYCVKKCLGPKICTPAVMFVFAKFFSRVLEIMLPLSIQQEMAGNITNRRPEGPLVKHQRNWKSSLF